MASITDLEDIFKKLHTKLEASFKTPEEKKKYQEALNDDKIKQKVSEAMQTIKKVMNND